KYIHDPSHVIESDHLEVKENLTMETIPVRVEDRMVKQLRGKEIPLVKVIWGGATPKSATWELEEKMRESYPDLFVSARPRGERTQTCKEEKLECSDRPKNASVLLRSSSLRGPWSKVVTLRALMVPGFEKAGYCSD
ncbi:hypothetical protein CR513_06058, partial [Mucuna pruriens]